MLLILWVLAFAFCMRWRGRRQIQLSAVSLRAILVCVIGSVAGDGSPGLLGRHGGASTCIPALIGRARAE